MTIKEYCESCKNKGSHKCHSCMGRYYDGVLQGKPTKYIKKQQTNADRIRAMSDEELAKFIANPCECSVNPTEDGYRECGNELCKKHLLQWLKQPEKENDL